MISPNDYFPRLNAFPHAALFSESGPVWEAVAALEGYIRGAIGSSGASEGSEVDRAGLLVEGGLFSSQSLFVAEKTFLVESAGILIEEGVRIEPGVVVKGPTLLCTGAEIRHGAYLRGSCLIGPGAIVGHATEVKNAAFLNCAEAGHFSYVGDSLLGANVNLGAGTKLANLQFRTEKEKRDKDARSIVIQIAGKPTDTGLRKLGAVVGEHTEIGCNAVTSPGTLLSPGCWVMPNTTVPKGVYPSSHLIYGGGKKPTVVLRKR